MIVPSLSSNDSIALPTTAPIALSESPFIATPGVEELTKRSPIWIGPFSVDTLQGTRPVRARTGRLSSQSSVVSSKLLPRITPGEVEMMPATFVLYGEEDLRKKPGCSRSISTTYPASTHSLTLMRSATSAPPPSCMSARSPNGHGPRRCVSSG